MRLVTSLTCLAILSFAAAPALAQTYGSASKSGASPASGQPANTTTNTNQAGDSQADSASSASTSGAGQQDKSGYDAKAAKKKHAKSDERPGYSQTTDQQQGNDAGNLVPFGPPR